MIEELLDEAINAYETAVVSIRQQTPPLTLFSFDILLQSKGKQSMVSLTQYSTTMVDERFMKSLFKLGSILKVMYTHVYSELPFTAPTDEQSLGLGDVVNLTYAQGYAAYKTILLHSTTNFIAAPREFVLSELNLIFSSILELYFMAKSLVITRSTEGGEEGGEEVEEELV